MNFKKFKLNELSLADLCRLERHVHKAIKEKSLDK